MQRPIYKWPAATTLPRTTRGRRQQYPLLEISDAFLPLGAKSIVFCQALQQLNDLGLLRPAQCQQRTVACAVPVRGKERALVWYTAMKQLCGGVTVILCMIPPAMSVSSTIL